MTTQVDSNPFVQMVAQETGIKAKQVAAALSLLEEGNTIPFIARYRKEVTGSLDEVQIHDIQAAHHYALQLSDRKGEVLRLIEDQGKLNPDLESAIQSARKLQEVEDLYRPYKQKRRTKAMAAVEAGLQDLADYVLTKDSKQGSLENYAQSFVNEMIESGDQALDGAHEILAQTVSDQAKYREFIRKYTRYNGKLRVSLKDPEADPDKTYQTYYDYSEKLQTVVSHRILALNRAEKEGVLTVKLDIDAQPAIHYILKDLEVSDLSPEKQVFLEEAVKDGYQRFIGPSIEREIRSELTEVAEGQAIEVFGDNLRHLLLQQPLKGKVVMGFDPAYRTGCKLAIINELSLIHI